MNPDALFLVTGDPRVSSRPAEAIRIAAGVGAWDKVKVTLYLHGPAVLALGELRDELVDGDHFMRYLPMLVRAGHPVLAQRDSPLLDRLGNGALPFRPIDNAELAAVAARSNSVLHF